MRLLQHYYKGSREFKCEFSYTSITEISLGLNVGLQGPNIEIHVPFGFFKLGWYGTLYQGKVEYVEEEQVILRKAMHDVQELRRRKA